MALSNIFREPRREITESAIGIAVIVPICAADYWIGCWLMGAIGGRGCADFFFSLLLAAFILIVAGVVLSVTHELGEGICNSMARGGLELRPKNRR